MKRMYKLILLTILVLTALACGLISNPLSGAKELASTAEATLRPFRAAFPTLPSTSTRRGAPVTRVEWHCHHEPGHRGPGVQQQCIQLSRQRGKRDRYRDFLKEKLPAAGWTRLQRRGRLGRRLHALHEGIRRTFHDHHEG